MFHRSQSALTNENCMDIPLAFAMQLQFNSSPVDTISIFQKNDLHVPWVFSAADSRFSVSISH